MDIATLLLFVSGLLLLIAGAEALVRGASRLAAKMGISPLVIGLTVVAFGTSAPEMAVSIASALSGQADISLGNVVGSNIFNILFILGISASITPLVVSYQLLRLDVPVMIGVSILLFVFALDGKIGRPEGIVLFLGIVLYILFLIYESRREKIPLLDKEKTGEKAKQTWPVNAVFIVVGLALLVLGSQWFTQGAVVIARTLGISELIIGLTVVAAGTSLPEAATSVIAAVRGERDIAVGNIVGSNIFNILAVLGISSIAAPEGMAVSPAALRFDIPVMIAVAVACLPVFFTGSIIARWEGALFLGYYIAYTVYLILYSTHHQGLPLYSSVMILFVIPLTALTLIVITLRALRPHSQ